MLNKIDEKLKLIYQKNYQPEYLNQFQELLKSRKLNQQIKKPNEQTVYLITYGDIITNSEEPTLVTLHQFLNKNFQKLITDIHILPMFPYTSDDGFSVVDYEQINPKLGDWQNLKAMSQDYRLMYDFVVNHISQSSAWFKRYLANERKYQKYFLPFDDDFDYSNVIRPRTSDLIHQYPNNKTAWTTFSQDQVDLNFQNIDVLVEMTRILLAYIDNGATSIRLDAIGFLWKESGTSCLHLKQTHQIIKLWRIIIDNIAPNVQIITETNVPHQENISYFGNRSDEANQVYQFALPPLTLHTFIAGDSRVFSKWGQTITKLSDTATYFNFLASHDGIGMRSVETLLTAVQKEKIIETARKNGAYFNYKNNIDGSKSIYEMNITFLDALKNNDQYDLDRFLAAHFLLLSMPGVPAIYYNSLLGTGNDKQAVAKTGINRRINRRKFSLEEINNELQKSSKKKLLEELKTMIKLKQKFDCFDPYADFKFIDYSADVIVIEKIGINSKISAIVNVTDNEVEIDIEGFNINAKESFNKKLNPYQYAWINHE